MKNTISHGVWKARCLCLLAVILISFTSLTAQVTLNLENATLEQVILKVKSQTKYQFFYDDALLHVVVGTVSVNNVSVPVLLDQVLNGKDISYRIDKDIVYLKYASESEELTQEQNSKETLIKGTVIDKSGESLIGVNIMIKGTAIGTTTDMDGNYTLRAPVGKHSLVVSYIGYRQQSLPIPSNGVLNVTMTEDSKAIGEVVVTALGIKREKKMLGYAVQELKAEDLNKTNDPSITGALQGKVAGLAISSSGTGLNGSTKITIRGNSSLTDNNQPLWVVDGVPFNDNNNSSASLYGGVDRGGAAVDINPDDVESISVLKGPNAAALYGSRAGNGVILVTTKKGSAKDGFGVTYSGNFTWTDVVETLQMQTKYGQGVDGVKNSSSRYSFGEELLGQSYTAWNGLDMPYQLYGNKMQDYFKTGFSQNHNVSVGGQSEKAHYRASFGSTTSDGLFQGEKMQKYNLDVKAGMKMNKYLSLDSKVSLSYTENKGRPTFGKTGEVFQLLSIPNNVRLEDLKHFSTPEKMHVNWTGPSPQDLNPYYVNEQFGNDDERWRSFGYFGAKINITDWLFLSGKYAFDVYRTKITSTNISNGIEGSRKDEFSVGEENFFEQNAEVMAVGHNTIQDVFRIGYTLGGNFMYNRSESLVGKAAIMQNPNVWYLNSAQGFNAAEQSFREKMVQSVFASLSLSYKEWISLDLTARNDWSSTLPVNACSFFYPSANLSFVLSDMLRSVNVEVPSWLTFTKIRLSAAQVGKDTDPYLTRNYVDYKRGDKGPIPQFPTVLANKDLKPEISTSYEAGLDMKFFNNRLGFDFTYYHNLTKNQIMKVPMSGAWESKWINAGEILNRGFEMMIYSTPVETKNFQFDLGVNLSYNNSLVVKLHEDATRMIFNGKDADLMVNVGAVEGGRLGDIFPLRAYKRDDNGRILVRNGTPLIDEAINPKAIGNIQPDFLASIIPSFTFYGVSISALFDMKFGGSIVSISEAVATASGTAKRTENRADIVVDGVNEDGTPNTTPISAEQYYKTIGSEKGVAEEFLYDASFIKLKEVAIGYSIPSKYLKKIKVNTLRVSLVGRNLCYLMKHTPGTSPEGGFDTSMFSQAIDFTSVPYSRTVGFSISLGF